MPQLPAPLLEIGIAVFLTAVLCVSFLLLFLNRRTRSTAALLIASALVVLGTLVVAVAPGHVPGPVALGLAVLALAASVIGGNPLIRRVLDAAGGPHIQETPDGGIVLLERNGQSAQTLLRGGTTIGYLERGSVTLAIIAGFPEAIAVIVAVKGIGRFSELSAPEARERFIIGTLASLAWAAMLGLLVRLAMA